MLQKKYLKLGKFCAFLVAFFVSGQTVLFAKTITDPAGEQWAYRDTKVYEAWDVATGSRNVVVAVIDNGFDMYHPDLYGNVWKNDDEVPDNGVDDDKNGYTDDVWGWNFVPEDVNGDGSIDIAEQMGNNDPRPSVFASTPEAIHHGTVVAGIIGGLGNNQQDGAGINWRVRLMNLKVANNVGEGSMVGLDRAVRYAVDNGAHVINLSIVGDVQTALRDVFRYAHEKGVVVVAAAGNDSRFLNRSPQYPVCVDEGESEEWVLGVSAIDESHRITHFSNVGSSCIDITAPGVNIASTLRYSPQYGLQNTYGTGWNGTSFAAPFVTGAAALLKSMHPEWTAKEISTTLLTTVHKTPPLDEAEYAHLYGAGLLQINKAVAKAASIPSTVSLPEPSLIPTPTGPVAITEPSLQQILAIDKKKGILSRIDVASGIVEEKSIGISGFQDIRLIRYEDAVYMVTVRQEKKKTVVTFYNEAWKKIKEWSVPVTGAQSLLVGNVLGNTTPEIILAPLSGGTVVYRVYSWDGKEVFKQTVKTAHTGVSLGLYRNGEERDGILVAYSTKGAFSLYHYTGDHTLVRKISLRDVKKRASLASGDVNGDGIEEYLVGGGIGEAPYLFIYNADGSVSRQWFGYDPSQKGIAIDVGDYDQDGKDDILVSSVLGVTPVRVWNSRGKKVAEWDILEGKGGRDITILPLVE